MIDKTTFLNYGGFFNQWKCLYGEDTWLMMKLLLNETIGIFPDPPQVIVHTDASDLSSNLHGPRPLPPYLRERDALIPFCPPPARHLLRELLYWRAMVLCREYFTHGQYSTGRDLVRRFELKRTLIVWRFLNEFLYLLIRTRNSLANRSEFIHI
jgi:hypothetical protein